MHTNGPEHHDCSRCGGRITNQPRITRSDGRVVCGPCYRIEQALAAEREACAQIVDKMAQGFLTGTAQSVEWAFAHARGEALAIAEEIRARG
jgi:hypothetical protein